MNGSLKMVFSYSIIEVKVNHSIDLSHLHQLNFNAQIHLAD